jgi:hypothetical protein
VEPDRPYNGQPVLLSRKVPGLFRLSRIIRIIRIIIPHHLSRIIPSRIIPGVVSSVPHHRPASSSRIIVPHHLPHHRPSRIIVPHHLSSRIIVPHHLSSRIICPASSVPHHRVCPASSSRIIRPASSEQILFGARCRWPPNLIKCPENRIRGAVREALLNYPPANSSMPWKSSARRNVIGADRGPIPNTSGPIIASRRTDRYNGNRMELSAVSCR